MARGGPEFQVYHCLAVWSLASPCPVLDSFPFCRLRGQAGIFQRPLQFQVFRNFHHKVFNQLPFCSLICLLLPLQAQGHTLSCSRRARLHTVQALRRPPGSVAPGGHLCCPWTDHTFSRETQTPCKFVLSSAFSLSPITLCNFLIP